MARPKGTPKTGGRQKGSTNKVTQAKSAEIAASGLTPLDYMLSILRDTKQVDERRDEMAKAAAPYCHARLSSIDANHNHSFDLAAILDAADANT